MRFLLISALKDLRRMRREPMSLATWIGTPLLVGVLMVAFFGREQPKPQGLVLISDQDKSFLSAFVMRAYTQDRLSEIFTVQQVPLQEGRRRIYSGDGSALLIIPKGFSQAVLGTGNAQMQLITNPSQSILPGIVESVTSILVEIAWRLQQFMGDDLKMLAGNAPPSDADIEASSVRYTRLFTDLRKYLDPPIIKVAIQTIEPNPGRQINIGEAMFPSMTILALMFLAYGMAIDIWKEKAQGTLRRVAMTPHSLAGFLGGKLLSLWLVFAALGAVSLLSGKLLIGAETGSAVPAVLWIAAYGGAMYVSLVLLNTFCPSYRSAMVLSNILVMTLMMLGGCFFPFELMPNSFAKIGIWTPSGRALIILRSMLSGQLPLAGLAAAFGAALGITALIFAAAAWRIRRRFII
jgi:ABC-type Na+ efflux pump permease subunit